MIYLKTFKLSESRSTDPNIYPFCIFKNKERNYSRIEGWWPYFDEYSYECEYELGENEDESRITRIPSNSRYIKSEEILYEIRKIQQDVVLKESIESTLTRERGQKNAKDFLDTKEGSKQPVLQCQRYRAYRRPCGKPGRTGSVHGRARPSVLYHRCG